MMVLVVSTALALAVVMLLSGRLSARSEREEAERARARVEEARLQAELARRRRIDWEHKVALQREAIVVGGDPRGLGDGIGRVVDASDRFRRVSAPAPPGRARPHG